MVNSPPAIDRVPSTMRAINPPAKSSKPRRRARNLSMKLVKCLWGRFTSHPGALRKKLKKIMASFFVQIGILPRFKGR
jgi:hypothetical protein